MTDLATHLSAIDRWEPHVRALVDFDRDAARRNPQADDSRGALAGWMVAAKDIVDIAGVPTRCGADFIPWVPAARNAHVIDRLIEHGACVIAKTVTTCFAHFDPGPTRNPWNLAHTPGGSSSGSAASVACNMFRAAIGTQTVGSVNRPAAFCGVVGFKPTVGWIKTDGVFPFSPVVDTIGFFTRDVQDMRVLYCALQAGGLESPAPPRAQIPDTLRIGTVHDMLCDPPDADMRDALDWSAKRLAAEGHNITATALPAIARDAYTHHLTLTRAEGAKAHHELFATYRDHYPEKLRELILDGQTKTPDDITEVLLHRDKTITAFKNLFEDEDLDVLVTPAAAGAAPHSINSTGDPRMNLLGTYTGCPTLTLPMRLSDRGLPLGMQLIAMRGAEMSLLGAGALIERAIAFDQTPPAP